MSHDVFVSYSHRDAEAAGALRSLLEAARLSVFIDFTALRSGDRWLDRLQRSIAECRTFVVLLGAEGVQRWVGAEVNAALVRHHGPQDDGERLPIHPLLLPGADADRLPPFLAQFQADRWQPGDPLPEALLQALKDRQPRAPSAMPIEGCPFVGLASYRRDQAHLFFGRRAEVLQALACLGDQQQRGPEAARSAGGDGYWRWLQVEGHSGSGKSSLVHAGLLPMVEAGALWPRTGLERWRVLAPMRPGERPAERLAELLEHALHDDPGQRNLGERHARFLQRDDPRALTQALCGLRQPGEGLLLVIDQFEELYTFAQESERLAFDRQLAEALADADCPLFVVSTVRSDFLDRMEQALPRLAAVYNHCCKPFRLPPIGRTGLREAIEAPARLAGVDVSAVLEALLQQAEGEPGALPLVQHALRVLWAETEGSSQPLAEAQRLRTIRADVLARRGGLAGMLRDEADNLLGRAERELPPGGRQAALELLLALTHPGPEGRHTRRRIRRAEAVAAAFPADAERGEKVLQMLAGERSLARPSDAAAGTFRLVTVGTESGPAGPVDFVDLIHETLLRRRVGGGEGQPGEPYWPALFDYVEAHKHRPELLRELDRDRRDFDDGLALARWSRLPPRRRLNAYAALPLAPMSERAQFLRRARRLWRARVLAGGLLASALAVWVAGGGRRTACANWPTGR